MRYRPSGISTRVSNLFAALAVLSLSKLVLLAVWSTFQSSEVTGTTLVESMLVVPASVYAQQSETEVEPVARVVEKNLSEEWQALRRRQEDVQHREQTLEALEREIDAKLNRLQDLEQRIQAMLEEADVLKDKKIRHLVDVYSNMKPKEAAKALEVLEEPVAVKILSGMRGRNAGEVLSFVDSEKAARLTEALTRMQMPFQ